MTSLNLFATRFDQVKLFVKKQKVHVRHIYYGCTVCLSNSAHALKLAQTGSA